MVRVRPINEVLHMITSEQTMFLIDIWKRIGDAPFITQYIRYKWPDRPFNPRPYYTAKYIEVVEMQVRNGKRVRIYRFSDRLAARMELTFGNNPVDADESVDFISKFLKNDARAWKTIKEVLA